MFANLFLNRKLASTNLVLLELAETRLQLQLYEFKLENNIFVRC